MQIHSKLKDYEVLMEKDFSFLEALLQKPDTEYVIDRKVYFLYPNLFDKIPENRLMLIEAKEENKVIDTALAICEKMTAIPAMRNAQLVSVGGGIIQDITGFAANILYRGIAWTFVPTTLLAACDSCIGGKTSLNYKHYKNLLGTFYPPDRIHICPAFFRTLTERDFESGMGEVIKFNIIEGPEGISRIEKGIADLIKRDETALLGVVESSLAFKKPFIEEDEFDRRERVKLNFAHTFGHAIETVTDYRIPHGTAVAIGMIMANHVAQTRGLLKKETADKAEKLLLRVIHTDEDLSLVPIEKVLDAIRKDKKQTGKHLTAILMTDSPKDLKIVNDLTREEVEDAFAHFKSQAKKERK